MSFSLECSSIFFHFLLFTFLLLFIICFTAIVFFTLMFLLVWVSYFNDFFYFSFLSDHISKISLFGVSTRLLKFSRFLGRSETLLRVSRVSQVFLPRTLSLSAGTLLLTPFFLQKLYGNLTGILVYCSFSCKINFLGNQSSFSGFSKSLLLFSRILKYSLKNETSCAFTFPPQIWPPLLHPHCLQTAYCGFYSKQCLLGMRPSPGKELQVVLKIHRSQRAQSHRNHCEPVVSWELKTIS